VNAIDRALAYFAPSFAIRRARARATLTAMDTARRRYEAGASGRRTQGWVAPGGSPSSDVGPALATLRARSRDLVRNNQWAEGAVRIIPSRTIGNGINAQAIPQGDTDEERRNDRVALEADRLWKEWAGTTECDAEGRRTFGGLQRLGDRETVEAGEFLIRRRVRRKADGLVPEGRRARCSSAAPAPRGRPYRHGEGCGPTPERRKDRERGRVRPARKPLCVLALSRSPGRSPFPFVSFAPCSRGRRDPLFPRRPDRPGARDPVGRAVHVEAKRLRRVRRRAAPPADNRVDVRRVRPRHRGRARRRPGDNAGRLDNADRYARRGNDRIPPPGEIDPTRERSNTSPRGNRSSSQSPPASRGSATIRRSPSGRSRAGTA